MKDTDYQFYKDYNVEIVGNDWDALCARVFWTQRNESRSRVCPYFLI